MFTLWPDSSGDKFIKAKYNCFWNGTSGLLCIRQHLGCHPAQHVNLTFSCLSLQKSQVWSPSLFEAFFSVLGRYFSFLFVPVGLSRDFFLSFLSLALPGAEEDCSRPCGRDREVGQVGGGWALGEYLLATSRFKADLEPLTSWGFSYYVYFPL